MEQAQWHFRLPFVWRDPFTEVPTFSWSLVPGYGLLSVDPAKHGPTWRVRNEQKYLSSLIIQFPNTHLHERIEVGVISHNSYFRAIKTRLIVDSVFKFYKYVRILMESEVFIAIMILWLRGGAVNVLNYLPP